MIQLQKEITIGPTLVVLVGPSAGGKSTFAEQFAPNEVVSADALREQIAGDKRRQDMNDLVMNEFDRLICNRLELGKRVVADATHIRDTTRRRTAKLAARYGARVIYVVCNRPLIAKMKQAGWREGVALEGTPLVQAHEETFAANERKILAGDNLADVVIDTRKEVPVIVTPLARENEQAPLADIKSRGFAGILFVGDVHGNLVGLEKMIRLAGKENLFLFFLGDLVDYASDTLKVADWVAELIFRGKAAGILGNHERKILRWVTQERIDGLYGNENGFTGNLSPGNFVTINQIKAMPDKKRMAWETRFIGMCDLLPHAVRMPRYYVVHGGANADMLDRDEFRFNPKTTQEAIAMFGETSGEEVNGFPERLYNWVEEIPPRMTVVVGHDCRCDTYPFVTTGAAGGRAIFLDTGSSKPERFENGRLSGMRLDIAWNKRSGFTLENERFYTDVDL